MSLSILCCISLFFMRVSVALKLRSLHLPSLLLCRLPVFSINPPFSPCILSCMHNDTSISSVNIIFHAYWPLFNEDCEFDKGGCGHDTDILWLIPCGHQNRTAAALQARPGPHDDDDDVYYYICWRLKPLKRQVRTSDSQGCAYLKTDLRLSRELDHENGFHVACITPARPVSAIATNRDFLNSTLVDASSLHIRCFDFLNPLRPSLVAFFLALSCLDVGGPVLLPRVPNQVARAAPGGFGFFE